MPLRVRGLAVAEWEQKAEYSRSEYLKADELLTDKKEAEQAEGELFKVTEELDEVTRKKEIALDLYYKLSTDTNRTDLFDKAVDAAYCILLFTNNKLHATIE